MATEPNIWDVGELGNAELMGANLTFRVELSGTVYEFMATFNRKESTKTLNNVDRAVRDAGMTKDERTQFMRAFSSVLPLIYRALRLEDLQPEPIEMPVPDELAEFARKEAERILNSEDPLGEAVPYLRKMVCGEELNAQKLFLKVLAVRTQDRRVKWIVIITGTEGSGKSTLMNIVTALCRCKEVGRLTRHALDYTDLEGYEVLVLKEMGYLDQEDQGLSTIKFLSVDDKGYTVEVPWRDPDTGEMTTKTYKIPPINVLSSSTRVQFDPQFERRSEPMNPDESEEQTKRVKEYKAELERQTIAVKLGTRRWTDFDEARAVLRAVVSLVKDAEVEIPFPSELSSVLRSHKLRERGDVDKLFADVRLYHLLIQQSQHVVERNGTRLVFASPAGAVRVVELWRDSFETMEGGLDKRTKQIVEAMVKLGYKAKTRIGMKERMALAKEAGKAPGTVYRFLDRLYTFQMVNKGKESEGRGAPVFYELLIDPAEMMKPVLASKEEVEGELYGKMLASGFAFLKSQNLDAPTLSAIGRGWARARAKGSNAQDRGEGDKADSNLAVKSFRRMWKAVEGENSPNQAKTQSANSGEEGGSQ